MNGVLVIFIQTNYGDSEEPGRRGKVKKSKEKRSGDQIKET
jgi:hypothetical protein